MAITKAVDAALLDAGLEGIADAVREKGGTTERLAFPDGIIEAVYAIPAHDEPYEGDYIVTPSTEEQVLLCEGKSMTENVVVEAIPNNYGLITYNGFELSVT